MLIVGKIINGCCIDLDYQGQGVVKYDGKVIFVPNLLIGEWATIEIVVAKSKLFKGKVIHLTERSESRSVYDLKLGSMDLVHLISEEQLSWQVETTKKTIQKITGNDYILEPTIHSRETFHYRNKCVFHVMNRDILTLGLYDTQNSLVAVEQFLLASAAINQYIALISNANIKIDYQVLKKIVFRNNLKGHMLVSLIATKKYFKGQDELVEVLKSVANTKAIILHLQTDARQILTNHPITIYGKNELEEVINHKRFLLNDSAFFQVNTLVMEQTYQTILKHIDQEDVVIDAFSGIAAIGIYLSNHVKHVYSIDINAQNILMAKKSKRLNHITNMTIRLGDVFDHIGQIDANCLIVDPPRFGLTDRFIDMINQRPFEKLIYLSCDLKSFSANYNRLKNTYRITHIYPIKMFYQTTELETLIILERI